MFLKIQANLTTGFSCGLCMNDFVFDHEIQEDLVYQLTLAREANRNAISMFSWFRSIMFFY